MNIDAAFPSSYLRAADLPNDRDIVVTIERVSMEDVGTADAPETKPVAHFAGKSKGLVLNRTNSESLKTLFGTSETDQWLGQRVALYVTTSPFRGQMVPAIRVRAAPASNGTAAPTHYGNPDPHVEHVQRGDVQPAATSHPDLAPVDQAASAARVAAAAGVPEDDLPF